MHQQHSQNAYHLAQNIRQWGENRTNETTIILIYMRGNDCIPMSLALCEIVKKCCQHWLTNHDAMECWGVVKILLFFWLPPSPRVAAEINSDWAATGSAQQRCTGTLRRFYLVILCSLKTFIYKQKTFHKILRMITTKWTETDPKRVIVGFGNWGNHRDSIIRGHWRGAVKAIKDKLKRWCELVDVHEFMTSKLCCCCKVCWSCFCLLYSSSL